MTDVAPALRFLLVMIAGHINERMERQLSYLLAENAVLFEAIGKKRVLLTDAQRARLGRKARALLPRERERVIRIWRPATVLGWYRKYVTRRYDGSIRRAPGRPRTSSEIRALVVRMAQENVRWGYTKIEQALYGIGISIDRTTVARILKEEGIEPAPKREPTWAEFLSRHWQSMSACDFFTVDILSWAGPARYHVLFVIHLRSRAVEIAGIVVNPGGLWTEQVARNLTDPIDGFLRDSRYLIHDRDPLFTMRFTSILSQAGVRCVQLPPRSPNLNAYAERFVRSIKEECLEQFVIFGERHLRYLIREYVAHYNRERYHQGLGGMLIDSAQNDNGSGERVVRRRRLGGTLSYYHRASA